MVNFNPNINMTGVGINPVGGTAGTQKTAGTSGNFDKTVSAVSDYLSNVDKEQKTADVSIMDLMSGKNTDINAVVASVAQADMSFKTLVGVRNKLIEAYKQTMNMSI